jgi:large subunit ribosomal protein L22
MTFKATHRFAPMSPRKARYVIDLIRGKGINEALNTLRFARKRAAPMIYKVVRAAMAAAEQEPDVDVDTLRVSEARVDGGPTRKGRLPRPRGMATPLHHRTCHIHVELSTPPEKPAPPEKAPAKAATKEAAPPKETKAPAAPKETKETKVAKETKETKESPAAPKT